MHHFILYKHAYGVPEIAHFYVILSNVTINEWISENHLSMWFRWYYIQILCFCSSDYNN